MSWEEIVGQPVAIRQLQKALKRNRVNHAYLFYGPEGVGKRTTARSLAQALNCAEQISGEFCGHCRSCRLIAEGKHPDVAEVSRSGTNIRLKQIQEIARQAQYRPTEGPWKVFVLQEAEHLNGEAANHLLKILEEPPDQTVFILTARATFGLLETILSRCQQIRFQALTERGIQEILVRRFSAEPARAKQIALVAEGSLSLAQELLVNQQKSFRGEVLELLSRLGNQSPASVIALTEGWTGTERIKVLMAGLSMWFRDLLVWQKTGDAELLINQDCLELIKSQAPVWYPAGKFLRIIQQARRKLEQHANGQLLLEVLLLELNEARLKEHLVKIG